MGLNANKQRQVQKQMRGFFAVRFVHSGEGFYEEGTVLDLHGGPTWTWTPIRPSNLRLGVSSSMTSDMMWPLRMWMRRLPRMMKVVLVPVVGVDEGFEFVGGAEVGDDGGAGGIDVGDLAAHGEEGAAALFVVLAGVFVGAVDVGLVTAEEPLGAGDLDTAVVDAGVAVVGDTEFCFEFEVFRRAAAPDEEAVLLEEIVRGNFADEDVVFDAPVLRVAVPVFEGAVEDGLEAVVGVDEWVRVGLGAGRWCEGVGLDGGLAGGGEGDGKGEGGEGDRAHRVSSRDWVFGCPSCVSRGRDVGCAAMLAKNLTGQGGWVGFGRSPRL